ncbi:MAG: DUF4831 family protein [Muribaculaceae bacterium]|nr:DUF4831 family protein [Muribaculaceae bacterium]
MRYSIAAVILAASIATGVNLNAQQTKILTADKHNEYGLVYTLPTTALSIDVTAERRVEKAGKYFQYAKKYIGTDKVIKADSESWSVKDVKVNPYGIADTSEQYLMQLKPGALTYISVSDDGMLLAINKEADAPDSPANSAGDEAVSNKRPIDMQEYLKYVDEDFLASQSSAKQAQMLAENLLDIRDSRISLTRGTAETMPTDGKQLELMLASLAHQEAAITAAFCGTEYTETYTRTFTFIPKEDGRSVLFRLSDFSGFVDADDLSGDPVYINVKQGETPELPVDVKGEPKKLPKDAVVYCIPGSAEISLKMNGETLYDGELEFSQFGIKFGLSPSLFSDKKAPSFAIFDSATGAIKEIGENGR